MATLTVYKKPTRMRAPTSYNHRILENGTLGYLKKIRSNVPGYTKYLVGKYMKKEFRITIPTKDGLEDRTIVRHVHYKGKIFFNNNSQEFFVVGASYNLLLSEISHFFNENFDVIPIDLKKLEEACYNSGSMALVGSQYSNIAKTIMYQIRRTDGYSFGKNDPDYQSGNTETTHRLLLSLKVGGEDYKFNIYANGRIARSGSFEIGTEDFEILKLAYEIVRKHL